MSYPIKELITQNIEATLGAIKVANGYSYNLNVQRYVAVQKYIPEHLMCLIYQDGEERVEQEQNTKDGRELRIAVDVFIQQGPDDTTPDDQYANIIEAEMTRALLATYTRGDLPIDTTIDPPH